MCQNVLLSVYLNPTIELSANFCALRSYRSLRLLISYAFKLLKIKSVEWSSGQMVKMALPAPLATFGPIDHSTDARVINHQEKLIPSPDSNKNNDNNQ